MTELYPPKNNDGSGTNKSFYMDGELALIFEVEERETKKVGKRFNLSRFIKEAILFFVKYRGEINDGE